METDGRQWSNTTQSYDIYDFAGYTDLNCGLNQARFMGTLIYASSDSTDIRVEANTQTLIWTASLPDGTTISGPITLTGQPHAQDRAAGTPDGLPYYCQTSSTGVRNNVGCNVDVTKPVVTSVQLPPVNGNSSNYLFGYNAASGAFNASLRWNNPALFCFAFIQ